MEQNQQENQVNPSAAPQPREPLPAFGSQPAWAPQQSYGTPLSPYAGSFQQPYGGYPQQNFGGYPQQGYNTDPNREPLPILNVNLGYHQTGGFNMISNEFANWLNQNGLVEAFTTGAGDTLFVNHEKRFGVLRKNGEYGIQSFYLDDIIEVRTYDDENLVVDWNRMSSWRVMERSTRFSTNEVYMNVRMSNQLTLKIQIFRGVNGNVKRNTNDHINLLNYACQLSHIVYSLACNAPR